MAIAFMPLPPETSSGTDRMLFQFNDGGRQASGFSDAKGDCVCRSIAIAGDYQYWKVFDFILSVAKKERITRTKRGKSNPHKGVYKGTIVKVLTALGWKFTPTMGIGTGCKVHLRAGELPSGRLIVSLSKHYSCVIDGVIHDTHNPDRFGTRCVYGYWSKV